MEPYRNPALPIAERVDDLLARMTRDEKIGQCSQVCYRCSYTETAAFDADIAAGRYGSRILSDGGFAGNDGAGLDVPDLNRSQKAAVEDSRLGIPLLYGRDVIYGQATIYPIPLAQAASFNPDLVEQAYTCIAREASAAGVHWSFAPMMDIARDPRWGRVIEGSGEDPYLASRMAVAAVRGFQGADPADPERMLACAKHYVGYGAAEGGRDYDAAEISEFTLRNLYLRPFQAAVQEAGVASVMSGFHNIGGEPVSGSKRLLTDVLKDEWQWDGFVVSDWGSVEQLRGHGVAADLREAAAIGFNAGVDMEMTALSYPAHLDELINDGAVAEARLDDAVRRILTAKFKAGLFERPYVDEQRWLQVKRLPEHVDTAIELACQSMVLLKNDGILPLRCMGHEHIVVGGPFVHERRAHIGSWSVHWDVNDITTIADGLQAAMDGDAWLDIEDSAFADRLLLKAVRGDFGQTKGGLQAVVLCVGESEANNGEASSTASLELPAEQEALIMHMGRRNLPLVVVNCSGRPLVSPAAERYANAILQAWNLGTEAGTAIARVLFGRAEPGGRLPITIPANSGQVPCYYNHKPIGKIHEWPGYQAYRDESYKPLYPFGYGLGYTTWRYENLRLSAERIAVDGQITATVTVANTGSRPGSTVVQCYLRDPVASIARPVRELVGFQRVFLQPGAQQEVTFVLAAAQLGLYGAQRDWRVEPGVFQVFAGGDSTATMQAEFTVAG